MAIRLDNTTITGIAAGGLPAGTVTNATLATGSVTIAKLSGHKGVSAVHTYTNSTRFTTSSSSNYNYYTFTFNKVSATSKLYIHASMPGTGQTNSGLYTGIGIDGSYDWSGYQNVDGGEGDQMWLQWRNTIFAAGTRTVTVNAIPIDGSPNQSVNVINPNSSDDSRSQQQGTVIVIYEVEP
jgi:hypothetical protein